MNPNTRKNMWRKRIERCLTSGMSNKEWCALNKIAPASLYSWMRKFRNEEPGLFNSINTREWIEVTKKSLAKNVSLAPVPYHPCLFDGQVSENQNLTKAPPLIHARVNGVEISVGAGAAQADITSVFQAAMSL